jgi:hypothetical protein
MVCLNGVFGSCSSVVFAALHLVLEDFCVCMSDEACMDVYAGRVGGHTSEVAASTYMLHRFPQE